MDVRNAAAAAVAFVDDGGGADKDRMRAPLRRRSRRGRDNAATADAFEAARQDTEDMHDGRTGRPAAAAAAAEADAAPTTTTTRQPPRRDIIQPRRQSQSPPSSVGSGRSVSNSASDTGQNRSQSAAESVVSQSWGIKMRRIAAAAVVVAACTWSVARSEDRGGPNGGPMSSREYTVGGHDKQVVCYWGTWANYRPGNGKFTPEDVDPALCTNVIYSFAGLDSETNAIKSLGRTPALPASSEAWRPNIQFMQQSGASNWHQANLRALKLR